MSFTMGDSVQKIGGGPRMTVLAVNGDEITCVWNELGNERKDCRCQGANAIPRRR